MGFDKNFRRVANYILLNKVKKGSGTYFWPFFSRLTLFDWLFLFLKQKKWKKKRKKIQFQFSKTKIFETEIIQNRLFLRQVLIHIFSSKLEMDHSPIYTNLIQFLSTFLFKNDRLCFFPQFLSSLCSSCSFIWPNLLWKSTVLFYPLILVLLSMLLRVDP